NGTATTASAASILSAVRQTVLSLGADAGPPDVILCGPIGAMPEVRDELSEALALKVRDDDEFDYSNLFNGGFRPASLQTAGCVSMLLSESPTAPVPVLNFRQGEFAFRGRPGDLRPFYSSMWLAAAVMMAAVMHFPLGP